MSKIGVPVLQFAGKRADVGDDAAVGVEERIEDERARVVVVVNRAAAGMRSMMASRISSMPMPFFALARMASSAGMERTSSSCFFARLDVGVGQVDLVDDRE